MEKSLAFWLDTSGHQHVPLAHFFQLQLRSAEEVALTAWVRCARFPVRPGPQPRILGCFLNYFIIIFHILYSFTNCCMKVTHISYMIYVSADPFLMRLCRFGWYFASKQCGCVDNPNDEVKGPDALFIAGELGPIWLQYQPPELEER